MNKYLFLLFFSCLSLLASEPLDYFLTGTENELSFDAQMKRRDGKKFARRSATNDFSGGAAAIFFVLPVIQESYYTPILKI